VRAHSSDVQWVIHNFTHREIVRAEPRADVPGSEGAVAGARRVDRRVAVGASKHRLRRPNPMQGM